MKGKNQGYKIKSLIKGTIFLFTLKFCKISKENLPSAFLEFYQPFPSHNTIDLLYHLTLHIETVVTTVSHVY